MIFSPTASPDRARRRWRWIGACATATALVLMVGWVERRRIASDLVDRHLAAAGVPARYRITALGPFGQRIEDVRIGDPAHPDLVARRIDLAWHYDLAGPHLTAVEADGVRLSAQWRQGRLTLGSLDRLLPKSSSGGPLLPDLALGLRDARIVVGTPAGAIAADMAGSGNLARDYQGTIALAAPALTASGCTIARASAHLAVRIRDRTPRLQGPIALAGLGCPDRSVRLGAGAVRIDARLAPSLDRVDGQLGLAGFAGKAGGVRFGPIGGTIGIAGGVADIKGHAALTLANLAAPAGRARSASLSADYRVQPGAQRLDGTFGLQDTALDRGTIATVTRIGDAAAGTPIGPVAQQATAILAHMLAGSQASGQFAFAAGTAQQRLRLDHVVIRSARADAIQFDGSGSRQGGQWRIAAALSGGGLPATSITAGQSKGAAPIDALLRIAPYRVGAAGLALTPLRIVVAAGTTRFSTVATIDGPLGSGRIEGLVVPIAGSLDRAGALRIGEGCSPIAFASIRMAAMTLDPGRVTLCGQPLVVRSAGGVVRLAGEAAQIALTGHSGESPIALEIGRLKIADTTSLAAEQVRIRLGGDDDPTHLAIAALDGHVDAQGASGTFADAEGAIRHVPLALANAAGTWRFDQGALHLDGTLGVSDRGESARFLALASDDVALRLRDGRIDATASLHLPQRAQPIATVTLSHDLARGTGGALLAVPGIPFVRDGLQPEMLTPLTLGVVANVAGTIAGEGRIDWSPAAVTSSGDFHTDRLDLAAAFGPVTGIAGTLHFTDLLGLVTAPHQEARIAELNPGVAVANGVAHFQLLGGNRVRIEDAAWPFAGGTVSLDPATLDFSQSAERRLTFRVAGLDAGAFIQQLDFPNISATGTFDGLLPIVFDASGGRIENGLLQSREPGTLAYVGELSNAQLGAMGKLAFDALKAMRYSRLDIGLDGKLDGEIVSRVRFEGVRQKTADRSFAARLISNLPFRFNIQIRAPFRGLMGSARSYANPALLLQTGQAAAAAQAATTPPAAIQPADSAIVR